MGDGLEDVVQCLNACEDEGLVEQKEVVLVEGA